MQFSLLAATSVNSFEIGLLKPKLKWSRIELLSAQPSKTRSVFFGKMKMKFRASGDQIWLQLLNFPAGGNVPVVFQFR